MSTIDIARAASLNARQDRALDKPYWFGGKSSTHREQIAAGAYPYKVIHTFKDGTVSRGLISVANAAHALADSPDGGRTLYPNPGHPLQGLTFAAWHECAKLIYDYAEIPSVICTPDSFEVETVITDAEWAHLTGA